MQVNAKVAGEVIRVGAEIGAEVKAGDLLVELEPTQYQLGTERSQAKVALAKARLSRAKRLANENARDPEGLEIAEAELTLAEIELRWSQNDLANTKIIAPIDGVILRKQAEVGMIADPKSPTGVHLYEMADLRHLAVLVEVAGVNRVARRQPCLIHYPGGRAAPGQAGETWKGEVENIGAVIDPNTGTFPVRVKIEGVGTSKVNPGAFVEVDFLAQD